MIDEFVCELYVYAPAFLANASPVIARRLPLLRHWTTPVQPEIFGRNKTVRGFLSGVAAAVAVSLLQMLPAGIFPFSCDPFDRTSLGLSVLAGALLGAGALAGDMTESALKRKLGLAPGQALPVWDGMDYILGAMAAFAPMHVPSLRVAAFLLLFAPLASLCANSLAYAFRWKDRWY